MTLSVRSLLLFCAGAFAFGQVPIQYINPCLAQSCFYASVTGSVASSATSKLTVQQSLTGKQINYIAAVAQCAGQTFTVDQSQNGTAASATAATRTALIPTTATATATAWSGSNVGSGTATAPTLSFTAGDPRVIDLSQRTTGTAANATTNNYTVTLTNTGAVFSAKS